MAHALLSPSKFERIIACPASLGQSMFQPSESSIYALEGTVAHHVLEFNLNAYKTRQSKTVIGVGHKVKIPVPGSDDFEYIVTEEMILAVDHAMRIVMETAEGITNYLTEQKVTVHSVHPECYGTADVVIINEREKKFHVIDYKHGQGELIKPSSVQLILYGLGVFETFKLQNYRSVVLHVLQPRHRGWVHEPVEIKVKDLFKLAEELKTAAKKAYSQRNNPEDYNPGVSQCKYCPGAKSCTAFSKRVLEVLDEELSQIMTLEEKLNRIPLLKEWIKTTENHAFAVAQKEDIPGYKLVNSMTLQRWKLPDDEIINILEGKLPQDLFVKCVQDKVVSPSQIRKLIDNETYENLIADLIEQPLGKLTLAPSADPRREAIDRDFADPTN
jgi:hypothetical protein